MTEPESWFYWQAYFHLRTSRDAGMGLGAIQFPTIMSYADFIGMECPVQRNRLVRMISAMDGVEMEMASEKAKT